MSDIELTEALRAATRGEDWGVRVLFRALQPGLVRYLCQKAPGVEQDLASETWLQVSSQLAGFTGTFEEFRALLFTIARRRVIDHYRHEARRPRADNLREAPESVALGPGPDEVFESLSSSEALAALVSGLPEAQAEVITLRVIADLSIDEIARVTGRSAGAVRVLHHRAIRRLARLLAQEKV
jgi:RNA polymerase sigma-70 factor (ECF subfamily)